MIFEELLFENLTFFDKTEANFVGTFLNVFEQDSMIGPHVIIFRNVVFTRIIYEDTFGIYFLTAWLTKITNLTIANLTFTSCRMPYAFFIFIDYVGKIEISDMKITENSYYQAFYLINAQSLLLKNSLFDLNNNNDAIHSSSSALFLELIVNLTITQILVSRSRSALSAAGIWLISYGNITIDNSSFLHSFCENIVRSNSWPSGCAIYLYVDESKAEPTLKIRNSTFLNNTIHRSVFLGKALLGAAALNCYGAGVTVYVEKCVFYNQSSSYLSTVIYFGGRNLTIIGICFQLFNFNSIK